VTDRTDDVMWYSATNFRVGRTVVEREAAAAEQATLGNRFNFREDAATKPSELKQTSKSAAELPARLANARAQTESTSLDKSQAPQLAQPATVDTAERDDIDRLRQQLEKEFSDAALETLLEKVDAGVDLARLAVQRLYENTSSPQTRQTIRVLVEGHDSAGAKTLGLVFDLLDPEKVDGVVKPAEAPVAEKTAPPPVAVAPEVEKPADVSSSEQGAAKVGEKRVSKKKAPRSFLSCVQRNEVATDQQKRVDKALKAWPRDMRKEADAIKLELKKGRWLDPRHINTPEAGEIILRAIANPYIHKEDVKKNIYWACHTYVDQATDLQDILPFILYFAQCHEMEDDEKIVLERIQAHLEKTHADTPLYREQTFTKKNDLDLDKIGAGKYVKRMMPSGELQIGLASLIVPEDHLTNWLTELQKDPDRALEIRVLHHGLHYLAAVFMRGAGKGPVHSLVFDSMYAPGNTFAVRYPELAKHWRAAGMEAPALTGARLQGKGNDKDASLSANGCGLYATRFVREVEQLVAQLGDAADFETVQRFADIVGRKMAKSPGAVAQAVRAEYFEWLQTTGMTMTQAEWFDRQGILKDERSMPSPRVNHDAESSVKA
jgi:hypothetical protein